jgi:hypothetical protein
MSSVQIGSLSWLVGSWECEIWNGTFQEVWLPPAGGVMVGLGRHMSDDQTKFVEYMSIETDAEGELTMYMILGAPSRGDKRPRPFKLTSFEDDRAAFENPENPFPSSIVYTRTTSGIECVIEGTENGEHLQEVFTFRTSEALAFV